MKHRPIILSLTSMHESGLRILREATELRMASALDPATLQREVVGAEASSFAPGASIDAALLDRGNQLRVVGRHGVGYDQIDVDAATARGVQVVYTPGANTQSVVEHVFALMIGLSRTFPRMMAGLAAGNYHIRTSMTGREIAGKTLGNHRIRTDRPPRGRDRPSRVRHEGRSTTTSCRRRRRSSAAANARRVGLREVLEASEYVTLHVPLDASTRRLINRETLALMRPDAILINTCRGPVVDEAAVAEALDAGRLWGYGADVFTVEPPPAGHPLIGRTDVMLTPHSAAQTEEGLRNMATTIAQEVVGVLQGVVPRFPVNDPFQVEQSGSSLGWSRSIGGA